MYEAPGELFSFDNSGWRWPRNRFRDLTGIQAG